jgi:uncharacterized YkwD family protein
MFRKIITISIISMMLIITSCGPVANQQAQELRVIDEAYIQSLRENGPTVGALETGADRGMRGTPQGQLSSECTIIPSDQFPNTTAVPIQHARYEFVIVDDQQQNNMRDIGRFFPRDGQAQPPEQGQQPGQAQPGQPQPGQPQAPEQAQPQQPEQAQPPQPEQPRAETGGQISEIEARVIQLTNEERRRNGLPELQTDQALSNVAREKSDDMQRNGYFSHTSPTYGSPFDMIRDAGISFQAAGENIAQGQPTPEQVVQAWMNSQGHRENILNGGYTHIGVGYNEQGHYWTQMFISR